MTKLFLPNQIAFGVHAFFFSLSIMDAQCLSQLVLHVVLCNYGFKMFVTHRWFTINFDDFSKLTCTLMSP